MKKLLIAVLAVAALANANKCEDLAETWIDDMQNCEYHDNDDDGVVFQCSNGSVALLHKNERTRFLGICKYLNKYESEVLIINSSSCHITHQDEYGVRDTKFLSTDVEDNSALKLWNYFKRNKAR